jgi:molybdopterin-guanine dinucleotide biosynthesis protein A
MGRDKARLEWQGRPLWQHQMQRLTLMDASRCLVACREEQRLQDEATLPGWEWLFDPAGDEQGPLGAVERALRLTALPLVVLAVDMPFMTPEFLRQELLARGTAGRALFFRSAQGIEPMAACYVPAMLPVMERRLARGERGLQRLIEECVALDLAGIRELRAEEMPLFANLNTPGEWEQGQTPIMA